MYNIIADRLKEAMTIKNVTLNQLADKTNISLNTLQNLYYAKNVSPRSETIYKVCKALDITADYLIGLTKYDKNELELLTNYQKCGRHGRDFLLVISRFEADYTTFLRQRKDNRHTVNCLVPDGHEADGFEYTTCSIEQIETVFEDAFMAIKITTDNFIPSFMRGDIIALADRYPKQGEKAVYYKDGRAYFREYSYENGKVILKPITGKGESFILDRMDDFKVLGTYINVIRWQ